jgi:hypothetical protein
MSGLLKTLRQFATAVLGLLLIVSVAGAPSTNAKPRPRRSIRGGQVTSVYLGPGLNRSFNYQCPAEVAYLGRITTDGPAEVKYTWVSSDGRTWPEQSLKFPRGRGKNVYVIWKVGKKGEETFKGWLQLKVLSPNEVVSKRSSIVVPCQK